MSLLTGKQLLINIRSVSTEFSKNLFPNIQQFQLKGDYSNVVCVWQLIAQNTDDPHNVWSCMCNIYEFFENSVAAKPEKPDFKLCFYFLVKIYSRFAYMQC